MDERRPLEAAMAAAFLKRLGEHLDFNINIMDRDGVIIASRDPARVGSYHESARRLVESGSSIESIEEGPSLPSGVKPGVNLPILLRGETIGVVGVTGSPREVEPVAYAVKTSVESMVELELYKEKAMRRQDRKNLFVSQLVYEPDAPRSQLEALARKLGYDPRAPRAPLILRPAPGVEPTRALSAIKADGVHGAEDISWVSPEGSIVVWKRLELGGEGLMESIRGQVEAYLLAAGKALGEGPSAGASTGGPAAGGPFLAYSGALQSDLGRYRGGYRQLLWLVERFPSPPGPHVSLYDHLGEFLASRIPRADLVDALDGVAALLPGDFRGGLRDSVEALFESAFNGKEAAARLGVHRNTLSARMERLNRVFGLDPRRDPKAREFLSFLVRYLELKGPSA